MAEEERSPGAGQHAKALKEDLSPAKLNAKLEEVIEERPKTAHLLDFRLVGTALLAAVVIALGLWVIVNAQVAALALVVVFLIGWLGGAQLSYDRRRETTDARSGEGDDDKDEEGDRTTAGSAKGAEEEDSPARQSESRAPSNDEEYQGDRGEAEADQEQTTSSNGSGPARERSSERE